MVRQRKQQNKVVTSVSRESVKTTETPEPQLQANDVRRSLIHESREIVENTTKSE
jgi:hypothetical protein